jgi:hypothetical protein
MNWKGRERKGLWPNLRFYLRICLEYLRKNMKTVYITGLTHAIKKSYISNSGKCSGIVNTVFTFPNLVIAKGVLKMKAAFSVEMLLSSYKSILHYNPEEQLCFNGIVLQNIMNSVTSYFVDINSTKRKSNKLLS